jgi:hypothetical protein
LLTRTPCRPLTCCFRHPVALAGLVRAARPSAQRPWSPREASMSARSTELITGYRNGVPAAFLAAVHGVSLSSLLHIAGVRWTPSARGSTKSHTDRNIVHSGSFFTACTAACAVVAGNGAAVHVPYHHPSVCVAWPGNRPIRCRLDREFHMNFKGTSHPDDIRKNGVIGLMRGDTCDDHYGTRACGEWGTPVTFHWGRGKTSRSL